MIVTHGVFCLYDLFVLLSFKFPLALVISVSPPASTKGRSIRRCIFPLSKGIFGSPCCCGWCEFCCRSMTFVFTIHRSSPFQVHMWSVAILVFLVENGLPVPEVMVVDDLERDHHISCRSMFHGKSLHMAHILFVKRFQSKCYLLAMFLLKFQLLPSLQNQSLTHCFFIIVVVFIWGVIHFLRESAIRKYLAKYLD